ncbi:hypothetical protein [Paenibacillus lactis]|uniref:hypothetical protein n=1 Tax=Paenibacillus lactis TaxID=228574 RepID=UPI003D7581DC
MTTELKQTNGKIRVEGRVIGFDPQSENTYREGTTNTSGKPYRSVSLNVKTSPTNVIYNLDLFGTVPKNNKVKVFSNKNGDKQSLELNFDERNNAPAGFTCFGFGTVGTGFEKENGRIKMKNYFNLDGAEVIKNTLENDASVWIDGEFNISNYISNGEERQNIKYTIKRIGLKDEIDFDQENFKEVASFEQEVVIVGHDLDKENKKLYVTGRIIDFKQEWNDVTFVVNLNEYEKLGQNIYKKTKFGDLLTLQGKIVNGVILTEAPKDDEFDWGGETPEGQGQRVIKDRISELQITNVKDHKPKFYKEDDFFKPDEFSGSPFEEGSDEFSDTDDIWG